MIDMGRCGGSYGAKQCTINNDMDDTIIYTKQYSNNNIDTHVTINMNGQGHIVTSQ